MQVGLDTPAEEIEHNVARKSRSDKITRERGPRSRGNRIASGANKDHSSAGSICIESALATRVEFGVQAHLIEQSVGGDEIR